MRGAWLALALPVVAMACSQADTPGGKGTEGGQWRSYAGDPAGTRYAPLAQIDANNFASLEIAWTWLSSAVEWKRGLARRGRTAAPRKFLRDTAISNFQVTPLMVDGVLYGVSSIGEVFALDAGTGKRLWVHDPQSYRSAVAPLDFAWPKHRGVTWWKSGGDERIFLPTIDAYLLALDAKTGEPVAGFGEGGRVDLLEGLRAPRVERLGQYFQSSPAALHGDTLIVGSSIGDRPRQLRGVPGDIRAYDARTGAQKWSFHVVPAEGEAGVETWEDGSWKHGGSANAWGLMSVDRELGRIYVPTSTPHNDLYGGHRPGDNLYAESLLCLDAETGARIWHQQLVRHGLWDYDVAAAPILVDLVVEGREIPAVVQLTKQAFAFVFDRRNGEPVWPIEERPVPASDVPGERTAATQRFPTKPPPFDRQGTSEEDLIDFSPELHAEALDYFRRYRSGPLFTPPSLDGTLVLPGASGGTGWQGGAVDPAARVLYVPSITRASLMQVAETQDGELRYVTGRQGPALIRAKEKKANLFPFKPPWSRITAIDLDRGEILWQVANGPGRRDHPRLAGLDVPPLGSGAPFCVLATDTLLIATDGVELFMPLGDPVLHAYDKRSGASVGRIDLPGRARGCPMTYLHEGRQYLVVAVSNRDDPQLVALALPAGAAADRP